MTQRQYRAEGLRDSGKGLDDVAEKVRSEWAAVKSEAGDLDALFGDGEDDVGGLLRSLYEVVLSIGDDTFTSGADDYAAFGKALSKMGDRIDETEQVNSKLLQRIENKVNDVPEGRG